MKPIKLKFLSLTNHDDSQTVLTTAFLATVFMTTVSLTTVPTQLTTVSSSVFILSHDPVQVARFGVRILLAVIVGAICFTGCIVGIFFASRIQRKQKPSLTHNVSVLFSCLFIFFCFHCVVYYLNTLI